MAPLKITPALRADLASFYRLREPICNADVRAEYLRLARKGANGIVGDIKLEALRAVFIRHGCDPLHG